MIKKKFDIYVVNMLTYIGLNVTESQKRQSKIFSYITILSRLISKKIQDFLSSNILVTPYI